MANRVHYHIVNLVEQPTPQQRLLYDRDVGFFGLLPQHRNQNRGCGKVPVAQLRDQVEPTHRKHFLVDHVTIAACQLARAEQIRAGHVAANGQAFDFEPEFGRISAVAKTRPRRTKEGRGLDGVSRACHRPSIRQ
jgi:hypothetical protein